MQDAPAPHDVTGRAAPTGATPVAEPSPPTPPPPAGPSGNAASARPRSRRRDLSTFWKVGWTPVLRPAGYFLLSRAAVFFSVLVCKWLFPPLNGLQALGAGWDGGWFVRIAELGYPHHIFNEGGGSRWVFFPAFPAAIRACAVVTGLSYPHAGLVVGFIFGIASAVGVRLAVAEVFGPDVADRTVLLYVFFPAAYVLSMSYSEGLFVAAAAFCLYALSRRYWFTAAAFAAVASLTRSFGIFLILAVVVTALPVAWRERRWRPLLATLLAPIGFVAWLLFSWRRAGTPLAFVQAEKYWGGSHFIWFTTPFRSFANLFGGAGSWRVASDVLAAGALLFVVVGLALLVWARRDRIPVPAAWWVYAVGSVLGAFSSYWSSGVLRYCMVLFPFLAAIAWRLRASWIGPVAGCLAVAQGSLAVMLIAGLVHPQATPLSP